MHNKSQRIRQEGDTLNYLVSAFRGKQDRTIADVIKKQLVLCRRAESVQLCQTGVPFGRLISVVAKLFQSQSEVLFHARPL